MRYRTYTTLTTSSFALWRMSADESCENSIAVSVHFVHRSHDNIGSIMLSTCRASSSSQLHECLQYLICLILQAFIKLSAWRARQLVKATLVEPASSCKRGIKRSDWRTFNAVASESRVDQWVGYVVSACGAAEVSQVVYRFQPPCQTGNSRAVLYTGRRYDPRRLCVKHWRQNTLSALQIFLSRPMRCINVHFTYLLTNTSPGFGLQLHRWRGKGAQRAQPLPQWKFDESFGQKMVHKDVDFDV